MFLRILLNSVIPPLKDYEKALFDNLIKKLEPDAGSLLAKQIGSVNYVQRHSNNKEVNLYTIKNNKPFFNDKNQFPNSRSEMKLASIFFNKVQEAERFQADFWIVNGYIFSIEFDKNPSKLTGRSIDITIIHVFTNPMEEDKILLEAPVIKGWASDWLKQFHFNRLNSPLPLRQRIKLTNCLSTALPNDYVEIISQTEGAESDYCKIFGISEIRNLILTDARYDVIAEIKNKGVLAVKHNTNDAIIFFIDYEDNLPIIDGTEFCHAIESRL